MKMVQYGIVAIIGFIVGQIIDLCNIRFAEEKKIFTKESIKEYFKDFKINYVVCIINALLYIGLLKRFGLGLNFARYAFLVPCLISAFIIDYHLEIIPNRLNLTIFEVGLIFAFICGMLNIYIAFDMLLGMFVGAGIFLLITLIGGLIAGKEAMGLGDVKLVGAMGLFFGVKGIIIVSILSFFIGGLMILVLLLSKKKTLNDYIPFGPSIVLSAIVMTFIPANMIISWVIYVLSSGRVRL